MAKPIVQHVRSQRFARDSSRANGTDRSSDTRWKRGGHYVLHQQGLPEDYWYYRHHIRHAASQGRPAMNWDRNAPRFGKRQRTTAPQRFASRDQGIRFPLEPLRGGTKRGARVSASTTVQLGPASHHVFSRFRTEPAHVRYIPWPDENRKRTGTVRMVVTHPGVDVGRVIDAFVIQLAQWDGPSHDATRPIDEISGKYRWYPAVHPAGVAAGGSSKPEPPLNPSRYFLRDKAAGVQLSPTATVSSLPTISEPVKVAATRRPNSRFTCQ